MLRAARAMGPSAGLDRVLAASHIGWCRAGRGVAWALAPERVARTAGSELLDLRFALVRLTPNTRHTLVPAAPNVEGHDVSATPFNLWERPGEGSVRVAEPVVFDFDGDGDPEVVLHAERNDSEGASYAQGRVWTFTEGGIFLYERAASFVVTGVEDVDRDGRPDLKFSTPFSEMSESCGAGFEVHVAGPTFVAHSLADGSFNPDDAVARAYLARQCPRAPTALVVRGGSPSQLDDAATALNVACARAWGVDDASLITALRATCGQRDTERACQSCTDLELLERWARLSPPTHLAPLRSPAPAPHATED